MSGANIACRLKGLDAGEPRVLLLGEQGEVAALGVGDEHRAADADERLYGLGRVVVVEDVVLFGGVGHVPVERHRHQLVFDAGRPEHVVPTVAVEDLGDLGVALHHRLVVFAHEEQVVPHLVGGVARVVGEEGHVDGHVAQGRAQVGQTRLVGLAIDERLAVTGVVGPRRVHVHEAAPRRVAAQVADLRRQRRQGGGPGDRLRRVAGVRLAVASEEKND